MKYLNTKYKLFLESSNAEVNKYEIVQFKEKFTIDNVYGIDREISININKGDKLKLYFDVSESQQDSYCITAIRPIEILHNESNKNKVKESTKTNFNLSELWEGNFVLNSPTIINKDNLPFTIEEYL